MLQHLSSYKLNNGPLLFGVLLFRKQATCGVSRRGEPWRGLVIPTSAAVTGDLLVELLSRPLKTPVQEVKKKKKKKKRCLSAYPQCPEQMCQRLTCQQLHNPGNAELHVTGHEKQVSRLLVCAAITTVPMPADDIMGLNPNTSTILLKQNT